MFTETNVSVTGREHRGAGACLWLVRLEETSPGSVFSSEPKSDRFPSCELKERTSHREGRLKAKAGRAELS